MIRRYEDKSFRKLENKTAKIKLNTSLRGYPKGIELKIKVDTAGTPLERYWRDRLKDSKIDNCIEIVE